ncbi:MAG: serine protease [bacterium]
MIFLRALSCGLLAACLLALLPTARAEAINPKVGARKALSSIVQVVVDTRFGTTRRVTGYRFSRGYVMVPFHAIADAERIRIMHADFGVVELTRFETLAKDMNTAVIYSEALYGVEYESLVYADTKQLAPDTPVSIFAHASYLEQAVSDGMVLDVNFPRIFEQNWFTAEIRQEYSYIHFSGYVDPGSAGGILVDENFELLGMIIGSDGRGGGYALRAEDMRDLQISSGIYKWEEIFTKATSDAEGFDLVFGPAPQRMDIQSPVDGGFLMWFAPSYAPAYEDDVFTGEILDKINGNRFHNAEISIDGVPLRQYSASRLYFWDADDNPWEMQDSGSVYVHFDADSLFRKRVYRDKETEERIMSKHIMCMPLPRGEHRVIYENRMANLNDSGVKRMNFELGLGSVQSLDIQGLSLVSMSYIDNPAAAVSQSAGLRYELQRRPLSDNDIAIALRGLRFRLEP